MPITKSDRAPYAPPSAILEVINRYRDHGLSVPIDVDVLQMTGVSESLAPRTLQALRLLDLTDDDGNPTQQFQDLRTAPSDEFQERFEQHIRNVYSEVFSFVDPASDPVERVEDAFRAFQPHGQRGRMVTMFMGLCEAAGIVQAGDRVPRAQSASRSRPQPKQGQSRTAGKKKPPTATPGVDHLPPAIVGLMAQLPSDGASWTSARRDSFIDVLRTTLNFVYPVKDEPSEMSSGSKD